MNAAETDDIETARVESDAGLDAGVDFGEAVERWLRLERLPSRAEVHATTGADG